jgi:hypothetical protein
VNCVNVDNKEFNQIRENKRNFYCKDCVLQRNKRRSAVFGLQNNLPRSSSITRLTDEIQQSTEEDSDKDFKKSVLNKLDTIIKWQNSVSEKLKSIELKMADLSSSIEDNADQISENKNEIENLHEKLQTYESRINQIEQNELRNNIEIHNIPEKENEDVTNTLKEIWNQLDLNMGETDIVDVKRIRNRHSNTSTLPSPIVVRFKSAQIKTRIFKAKKDYTVLITKDNKNEQQNTTITKIHRSERVEYKKFDVIYINEQLTKENNKILKCARDLKREKILQSAYTLNGRIFIKKSAESRSSIITHISQLNDFK